jgi:hypothetical protein
LAFKAGAFNTRENKLMMPLAESNTAKTVASSDDELVQVQFAQCMRELFLQKFVEMFASYEKYVIIPSLSSDQIDTWWKSREYAGNFDSKMFLIEQPSQYLPFLTHFLPSQMFVSFIDLKIISLIDTSKPADPAVRIFDERIKQFKEANANDLRPSFMLNVDEIEQETLRKWSQEPLMAPKARQRADNSSKSANELKTKRLFEHLDREVLREDPAQIEQMYERIQQRKKSLVEKREQFSSSRLISFDKTVILFRPLVFTYFFSHLTLFFFYQVESAKGEKVTQNDHAWRLEALKQAERGRIERQKLRTQPNFHRNSSQRVQTQSNFSLFYVYFV